ncbi:MAG TPA: bacillithiol biosynthesis cysteine-adding enzyme BshC [Spirochaetia bacterium]
MVHSIALHDLPTTSQFLNDFWQAKESVRRLVPRHFLDTDAFAGQARVLAAGRYDRAGVADVLAEQNARFGAARPAMESIERLRNPRSMVVIGGQQAGLFGGPLYTVHKALTVLSLARRMAKELDAPVVPLFWIASEDSDLAEVDHAYVTGRDGALAALRIPGSGPDKVPVSSVRLGDPIASLLRDLEGLLPEGPFVEEVLAELRAAYTPGRTYPQAFGAWMAWLFSGMGLAVVDPSDDRLKRIAAPLFEREILEGSPVSAAVMEQTEKLVSAGYGAQIELRPGFLTLFHQDPARDAIVVKDRSYELKSSGKRYTREELRALLASRPGLFTPNAVLRPLFQDTLFPTLACVLGPAELAYFSELTLAYERMGVNMPLMFPRASLTLVEPKVEKLRSKLAVGIPEVIARGERIIDDILSRGIPASLTGEIASARDATAAAWRGILSRIDSLDPTLHRTAELGSNRALYQLDVMERKVAQAARRKNALLRDQVNRLVAALAPRGGLQERTLCTLPFLARHGRELMDTCLEAIDPFAPEHRVVELDG